MEYYSEKEKEQITDIPYAMKETKKHFSERI